MHALTPEQQAVVNHPGGSHARVLAVAGSGKTTTMVHRIMHLLATGVSRSAVQVVMFNLLARKQFADKLTDIGCPPREHPAIDTFHSCAYRIIKRAIDAGIYAAPKEQLGLMILCRLLSSSCAHMRHFVSSVLVICVTSLSTNTKISMQGSRSSSNSSQGHTLI